MAPPPTDRVFGVLKDFVSPAASDDRFEKEQSLLEDAELLGTSGTLLAAGMEESESLCKNGRPSVCTVPRFTVFMPLKSIVTALLRLAALAIGVWPPPRTAALARNSEMVLTMRETSDALFGNTIH